MAPKEDVQDIIQSFVDNDLASLDRIGGGSDSYTLSPHLAEPSSVLTSPPERTSSKTVPQTGGPTNISVTAGASGGVPNGIVKHGENGVSPTDGSTAPSESHHTDIPLSSKNRRSTPDNLQSRHVSSSSTTSTSTIDRDKRASFGDKFKKFGKRITSSSKK